MLALPASKGSIIHLYNSTKRGNGVVSFSAAAPRDVIGDAPVGRLDEDLRLACLGALECSRQDCRDFALGMTWETSARGKPAPIAA